MSSESQSPATQNKQTAPAPTVGRTTQIGIALATTAVIFIMQLMMLARLNTHDITALFRIGDQFYNEALSETIEHEPYIHQHSPGFDGQFFFI